MPVLPGARGFFGYSGTVQPQVAAALLIIKADFPVLVKKKSYTTLSPSFTWPKSCDSFAKVITGAVALSTVDLPSVLLEDEHALVNKKINRSRINCFIS